MKLGAFSISLNVENLDVSENFYKKLGFETFAGNPEHNYLIMKNGDTLIGLFKGHIDRTTLTFNPGWSQDAKNVDPFDDVREIQKHLQEKGVELITTCDDSTSGPAYITLIDPDGHAILIDQHR
ncbi:Glyoxalase-like domain-containing protein [Cognatiyoonia koreensis]|uniref:Glyoxalase-like domain-containing protein n=1 Tax=Cognatiyoonia koreensis TaxID=364200 RepID=A0A1I0RY16_9RHOB|nr:VOC family protein [Cognatiyoonia koreensis]SEW46506.1 Glyoxalase-like domain-containing protein [Cognatiyoonia koreensis]